MEEKLKQIEEALEWCYGPDYREIDEARETYYNLLKEFEDEQ